MRAVYAEHPFSIGIRDIDIPNIRDDEVLIKVAYAGICGSDLHAYHGLHAFRKPPVMLGHEVSGTIAKMGPSVSGLRLGQPVSVMPQINCGQCRACRKGRPHLCENRIMPAMPGWNGLGTFGDYFAAPASVICPLGDVPLDLGALTEPLAVATHLMSRIPKDHDDELVIIGAGTIGLLLLLIAPSYGFKKILITDIIDKNLELAKELGAEEGVNALSCDAVQAVKQSFGALGCENIIVAAGGPDIMDQAIQMARPGANIMFVAMITSDSSFGTYPIVFKELNILGSFNYTLADFDTAIHFLRSDGDRIRRIITHVKSIDDAAEAFHILDKKSEFAVKILLQTDPADRADAL